jgi:hypothetical protein
MHTLLLAASSGEAQSYSGGQNGSDNTDISPAEFNNYDLIGPGFKFETSEHLPLDSQLRTKMPPQQGALAPVTKN